MIHIIISSCLISMVAGSSRASNFESSIFSDAQCTLLYDKKKQSNFLHYNANKQVRLLTFTQNDDNTRYLSGAASNLLQTQPTIIIIIIIQQQRACILMCVVRNVVETTILFNIWTACSTYYSISVICFERCF
jgi:hypothetical protein